MAHQVDPKWAIPLSAALPHQRSLLVLARLLRRNVDAVSFVMTAFDYGRRHTHGSVGVKVQPPGIDAKLLCRSIRAYALFRYGSRDDAVATLRFWRIERGEDLGEIVAALVEGGLLQASENESPHDFAGLFTLNELFADPPAP